MNFNWDQVPEELYTNLGNSGLKISKIIVGCMSYGKKDWLPWVTENEDQVLEVMKSAFDKGIRTYDTADTYSRGYSEILLGKFIKKYNIPRDQIVILTKVFYPVAGSFDKSKIGHELINSCGLSRKHIMDAIKDSMERLGTYIDLYQIHRFDPFTPIEETMEALHDCIKLGYTRYIGASSMKAYQFIMMQNAAEKHGWTKFVSMQSYYNLLYRWDEEELNAYCNKTGVGLIPWSPNAFGILTRPYGSQTERSTTDYGIKYLQLDNLSEGDAEIIKRVEKLSKDKNVSMAAISSAWVMHKGASPIVGLSKPERVDDILTAITVKLTEDELKYLEETYTLKYINTGQS